MRSSSLVLAVLALALSGCGGATAHPAGPEPDKLTPELPPGEWVDPEAVRPALPPPVRPSRPAPPPLVIRHATLLTADGKQIDDGAVVVEGGRIKAIGAADLPAPAGAREVDGTGRFVTPGIIDTHSHIGVYPQPGTRGNDDGNEWSAPITAAAAAEYGYWPQDPAIARASAGGVTVAQILPGSANIIGGRGVVVEMRPGLGIEDVRFPGAPQTIKMACGENPKRVHGDKGGPRTRMGEYAELRAAFLKAIEYQAKKALYARGRATWLKRRDEARRREAEAAQAGKPRRLKVETAPEPPAVDGGLEVLAGVLRGDVLVQVHCYRASDMLQVLAIADETGFQVRSFHHALEAYKIRGELARRGISVSTWADWWGFKMEAFDGIPENAALVAAAGGRAVIHSDSEIGIQRLNQEAAKAMYAGRAAGLDISEDEALRWVTANPAWTLGILDQTGTLTAGKRADLVMWSKHPLSVYARPELVLVAGAPTFERARGLVPSDFELGYSRAAEVTQ